MHLPAPFRPAPSLPWAPRCEGIHRTCRRSPASPRSPRRGRSLDKGGGGVLARPVAKVQVAQKKNRGEYGRYGDPWCHPNGEVRAAGGRIQS